MHTSVHVRVEEQILSNRSNEGAGDGEGGRGEAPRACHVTVLHFHASGQGWP